MNGSISEVASAQLSATRVEHLFSLLKKLATGVAILASAGAVSLHLIGSVAQQSYLWAFNVDPDGFPRTMDWIFIYGYYSIVDVGIFIVANFDVAVIAVLLVFLVIITSIFRWNPRKRDRPAWIEQLSGNYRVKFWILNFIIPIFSVVTAYAIFMFSLLVAVVPVMIGKSFGDRAANADIALFKNGCVMDNPCSQIWMNGSLVATGFVIATSADRVAFYDVDMGMVRQLEQSGMELRSISPKFAPGKAKQTMSGSDAPSDSE